MMATTGTDAPTDGLEVPASSGGPPDPPSGGAVASAPRVMRDRSSSPGFFPELLPGGRPPSPPGPPSYGAQISRAQGLDAGTTYLRHSVDFGLARPSRAPCTLARARHRPRRRPSRST
jgi:hypothetical protein